LMGLLILTKLRKDSVLSMGILNILKIREIT